MKRGDCQNLLVFCLYNYYLFGSPSKMMGEEVRESSHDRAVFPKLCFLEK